MVEHGNTRPRLRVLRKPEVIIRVGYSGMHINRLERAGRFPRRVRLGPNAVGWLEHEVDGWIEARLAERDAVQGGGARGVTQATAPTAASGGGDRHG